MTKALYLAVGLTPLLACGHSAGGPTDVQGAPSARSASVAMASEDPRAGRLIADDPYGDAAEQLVYLDQGWDDKTARWFYFADQGSVLMPYETLLHLETAEGTGKLIAPENMARFRFLAQAPSKENPDGLPIGLARHGDQVGLTCAACHTAQIHYQGAAMRVDGAPALVDVIAFIEAVDAALEATLADDAKLARFAAAVSQGEPDISTAKQSLTRTEGWFTRYIEANRSDTPEGFGRMDAVGRILNRAIGFTSSVEHSVPPNAPTNFPVLWDTPRHDYVQWTGFIPNAGPGSLGRNTGQAVGVFGDIEVRHYTSQLKARRGYPSTIEMRTLIAMEETLRDLESPLWPEDILPPINQALAAEGAAVYQARCSGCHELLDRDDPQRAVTAMITGIDVVGTDPTAARNVYGLKVPSGILEGAISPTGEVYGAEVTAVELVNDLLARLLATRPNLAARAAVNARRHGLKATPKAGKHTAPTEDDPYADLLAYKARPLNGIWASAPFLHNGSVPTLYDMLLPPEQRPARFSLGRMELDPVKVGYVSSAQGLYEVDTTLPGNSNQGHTFGASLTDTERWAVVEYLKTL